MAIVISVKRRGGYILVVVDGEEVASIGSYSSQSIDKLEAALKELQPINTRRQRLETILLNLKHQSVTDHDSLIDLTKILLEDEDGK